MAWTVATPGDVVDAEIEALPADMRARLVRLSEIIEDHGVEALPRETVDHLEEKLWELRIRSKSGISRAIYVTASGRRVVIVRVFVKKTQKTPSREIKLARERAKDER